MKAQQLIVQCNQIKSEMAIALKPLDIEECFFRTVIDKYSLADSLVCNIFLNPISSDSYICKCDLQATATLECVRCLKSFKYQISTQTNATFKKQQNHVKEAKNYVEIQEHQLTEEHAEVYYYKGAALSLEDLLVDAVEITIPELPICDKNCRGLCKECGENLNETNCIHHK